MPLDRSLPDEPREALKMLWDVAQDQQIDIYRHRDSLHKVWHVAPVKPREGLLVYADGTDWNPGSGAGYYVYYAGAWHAMSGGGGGGGGAVTSVFTRIGDVIAVTGDYTAAQVTNAVSILGSYANPAWSTSLAYAKLTGVPTSFTPAAHVHAAADVTTGVMAVARLGTGTPSSSNWLRGDGAWTALPASAVTSVFTRTGAVIAASGDYTAAQVTNAVSVLSSYADPSWITSLAYAKITGAPSIASIQTPWLQNINGAGFNLTSVGSLGVGVASPLNLVQVHVATDQNIGLRTNARASIGAFNDAGSAAVPLGFDGSRFDFSGGNVGIGTIPSYQLHLSTDSAAKLTTTTWTVTSDARIKRNVQDLQGGLDIIAQLRPIEAEYNGLAGTPEGTRVVGFIAQELQAILPGTVDSHPGKLREEDLEEVEILGVNIHEVLMHAILAIKQLKAKVEALELAAATP